MRDNKCPISTRRFPHELQRLILPILHLWSTLYLQFELIMYRFWKTTAPKAVVLLLIFLSRKLAETMKLNQQLIFFEW